MSREKQIEEMAHIVSNSIMVWAHELPPISNPHFVATAIYTAGYRRQEWISVEERLPEDGGEALIYGDKVGIYTAYYDLDYGFYGFGDPDECSCIDNSDVTHWMPLPEPPKKGGAE